MIEADLSGNQKEYILKLQFNWRWLITLDYVTLLIHKTKARIVGLLDYVQSSPSICGWIRPRAMLLTSQDPVDQKRRKPITIGSKLDSVLMWMLLSVLVMQACVLYWLESKFAEKGR